MNVDNILILKRKYFADIWSGFDRGEGAVWGTKKRKTR